VWSGASRSRAISDKAERLLTRYFVLYLGWTLEFMLSVWRIGPKGPQGSGQYLRSSLGFMHQRRVVRERGIWP
jgi:hypothetical protein